LACFMIHPLGPAAVLQLQAFAGAAVEAALAGRYLNRNVFQKSSNAASQVGQLCVPLPEMLRWTLPPLASYARMNARLASSAPASSASYVKLAPQPLRADT